MAKTSLICGSYAYDNIMLCQDKFKNCMVKDSTRMLNMSFLTPTMHKEFGGCAGNISYNLNLLGETALPMGTVGKDFTPYFNWIKKQHISTEYIKVIHNAFTGQAFIITDIDNNQITAFYPGAINESHQNTINKIKNIDFGIVSPDGRDGTIQHAKEFFEAKIPFIFDPGQNVSIFSKTELIIFIEQANYIAVNCYEAQLLVNKTKLSLKNIAAQVEALIITKGKDGSEIYNNGNIIKINPAQASSIKEPTGCGDAYRAGLLFGLMHNLSWQTTGQLAGLLGAIKISCIGPQNHHFKLSTIKKLYQQNYNKPLF